MTPKDFFERKRRGDFPVDILPPGLTRTGRVQCPAVCMDCGSNDCSASYMADHGLPEHEHTCTDCAMKRLARAYGQCQAPGCGKQCTTDPRFCSGACAVSVLGQDD